MGAFSGFNIESECTDLSGTYVLIIHQCTSKYYIGLCYMYVCRDAQYLREGFRVSESQGCLLRAPCRTDTMTWGYPREPRFTWKCRSDPRQNSRVTTTTKAFRQNLNHKHLNLNPKPQKAQLLCSPQKASLDLRNHLQEQSTLATRAKPYTIFG